LTSRLSQPLKWASLVVGGTVTRLGELRPNETRDISADLSSPQLDGSSLLRQLYPTEGDPSPAEELPIRDLLQGVLNASINTGPRVELDAATLVGWLDENSGGQYLTNSRTRPIRRTLLVATLPMRAAPSASIEIPPALVTRRSLTTANTARAQSSELVFSNGDGVSFEYRLPFDSSQFAVESLRLDLAGTVRAPNSSQQTNPLSSVSTTFLYDWQRGQWVQIDVAFGQNVVDQPERFVSPLGLVRLRFSFRVAQAQFQQSPTATFQTFVLVVGGRTR
jgi:hypothetical protein